MNLRIKLEVLFAVLLISLNTSVSTAQPVAKVVNGTQAEKPLSYMAALYTGKPASDSFFCGGSLVAPGWILTAAHCAQLVNEQTVVGVGGLKVNAPRRTSLVKAVYFDNWDPSTIQRDWALLRLKKKLRLKSYPKLAKKETTGLHRAFGWGSIDPWGGTYPLYLQTVVIPVWSQSQCIVSLGNAFNDSVMICGGVLSSSAEQMNGQDTCYGDSGGPMTNLSGSVIYGLTSWGYECAGVETPGVYASVSVARKWILKTIKGKK